MNQRIENGAFSSEEKVKEIATQLIFLSGKVHDALRRLPPYNTPTSLLTPYALLTEEYALRFRANILSTDAKRFVIPDFEKPHAEVMKSLADVEAKLSKVANLDDLSDLLSGLTLFSNSIISKKKGIISMLFEDLMVTAAS